MSEKLARAAISAALTNNWQEARKINEQILELDSDNIDALNRLANALYELGETKKAIEIASKALNIDPLNPIAQRCLKRFKRIQKLNAKIVSANPQTFLEEPGKTKIVNLIHLADHEILLSLTCSEKTEIVCGEYKISITRGDGTYIGKLPDDLANRLIHLIKAGNKYDAYIKSVNERQVKIFLRETYRAQKNQNPTFIN